MTEWTLARAVDVCLHAYAEHLLRLIGQCPKGMEMTGPDGTVVNLTSVSDVMSRAFDRTVREVAAEVHRPLEVHRKAAQRLAGTREGGFIGVLLAPFTFRPTLGTVIGYLNAELKRRIAQFETRAREGKADLHAPLEVQAERAGRTIAYVMMIETTKRYRKVAAHAVIG